MNSQTPIAMNSQTPIAMNSQTPIPAQCERCEELQEQLDALHALLETKPDAIGPKEAACQIHTLYGGALHADEIEERYRILFNPAARFREVRSVVSAYEKLS